MFITCAVVIVFVAAFLLREWIIQNTPPENNLEDEIIDPEENNEIIENNLRQDPPEEVNGPNPELARENQFGDFIFNNGNRLPLIMPPQQQPQPQLQPPPPLPQPLPQPQPPPQAQRDSNGIIIPTLIRDDRSLNEMLEQEKRNHESTPKLYHDEDSSTDLLERANDGKKSLLNFTDDEGSSSIMSAPTLVRDDSFSSSSLATKHNSDINLERELLDESTEVRDAESERDSSSSLTVEFNDEESFDFEDLGDDETGKSIDNRKSRHVKKRKSKKDGKKKLIEPIDHEDVSGTSTSLNFDFLQTKSGEGLLADNGEYDEIANISDSEDVNIQEKYPRELGNSYSPSKIITNNSGVFYDKFSLPKRGSASSSLAELLDNNSDDELSDFGGNESDNYEDDGDENESDDSDNSDNGNDRENVEAVEPEAPGAPVAPVMPAPLFNEAIDAPVAGQAFVPLGEAEDEDDDNAANEDLEGVLEAIGMRGSLWMLAQNSALMSVLIALCLAGSVWVPYIVGKTVLLVCPLFLHFLLDFTISALYLYVFFFYLRSNL